MKFSKQESDKVLDKLKELKKTFQLGEKIVPIIQSLTNFMQEVVPLLQNTNLSISESSEKMPIAKNQIENVTNATELATTEILDQIDAAGNTLTEISEVCDQILERNKNRNEKFDTLKKHLQKDEVALKLVSDIEEITDPSLISEKICDNVQLLNDRNFQVTMSLQVQDITSQQLAAVNHLINSVHEKLMILLGDFDNAQISESINDFATTTKKPEDDDRDKDFNAKATYAKDNRQDDADDIIEAHKKSASQDEIDKLFGGG